MGMGFGLSLEQTQKLIMTPELRQAINILQFSTFELAKYIEQQVLENPLLEENPEREERGEPDKEWDFAENRDMDWQEYFRDRNDLESGGITQGNREFTYENMVAQPQSLEEYLQVQMHLALTTPQDREIGEFLIGNLDDNGYLQVRLSEAADALKVDKKEVERVLKVLQTLDPPGVGARTLAECLLIQLEQREMVEEVVVRVIQEYLGDLAAGRLMKIASALEISVKEVQEIADLIKSLDPKPGRGFSQGEVRYIVPDVVVERVDGTYIVLVNDVLVPRLGINATYKAVLSQGGQDPETRRFVEGKLNAASWLIRSIEQRRLTLYKVVSCIVDLQREFFDKGLPYLKPLNLKEVAEITGVHESTVSRATAGKYVQTPQGLYELKFFFSSGIQNQGGEKTSSATIKRMLKEMVEREDPCHPLSDQRLAELLQEKGFKISRRTITKYREGMNIPATLQRRRY